MSDEPIDQPEPSVPNAHTITRKSSTERIVPHLIWAVALVLSVLTIGIFFGGPPHPPRPGDHGPRAGSFETPHYPGPPQRDMPRMPPPRGGIDHGPFPGEIPPTSHN